MNNVSTSAQSYARAAEKEQRQKEHERKEREFDKNVFLAMINELKTQTEQLNKQKNALDNEFKKQKKYNHNMFVATIISIVIAIGSLIVAIIAIIK